MRDIRRVIYTVLPERYTDHLQKQAEYARYTDYRHTTASLLIGYVFVALVAAALLDLSPAMRVVAFIGMLPFGLVVPYVIFETLAERRKSEIEEVLPDALLLMSANVESGLTIDRALLLSARDEFGPLADDIRQTAMKMFGGEPVDEALGEMAERTNSGLFEETLKLLIDGINAGGKVSKLLESSADDIRKSMQLRDEIAANVKMYSIFILMASILGAPLLFGISVHLMQTTQDMWSGAGVGELEDAPTSGPVSFSQPDFDVGFFRIFAIITLAVSNGFAALIISEIKNGTITPGFKYVPVYILISVTMFLLINSGLGAVL